MEKVNREPDQSALIKKASFRFTECGELLPPVIQLCNVNLRYKDDQPYLFADLDFAIDLDSRVAFVGPYGVGKTLLKLIGAEVCTLHVLCRKNVHDVRDVER